MPLNITTEFHTTTRKVKQKTVGYIPAIPAEWWGDYVSPSGGYVNYAKYQVYCVNPKTNRKNKRIYDEPTEEMAIARAKADGFIEPFEVVVLPSREPTDGQLDYAAGLGIKLPPDACFDDVSALLSRVIDDDEEPVCEELAFAAFCNAWKLSRYSGTKLLLEIAERELPAYEYKELLQQVKEAKKTNNTPEYRQSFEKNISALSTVKKDKSKAIIGFSACFVFGILGIFFIPHVLILGIILLLFAIYGGYMGFKAINIKEKSGKCPYCNTLLYVKPDNSSFKCPVCGNVGIQTETTLETK